VNFNAYILFTVISIVGILTDLSHTERLKIECL